MAAPKKSKEELYAPLLTLPPQKLQHINNMIFAENKIKGVIKILQEDYGIFLDYKPDTLRIYLHNYKKEFRDAWYTFNKDGAIHIEQKIPDDLVEKMPKGVGDPKLSQWIPYGKVKVLLQEAVTKFDAMNELERLALMQYDRVIKAIEYEEKLPNTYTDKQGKEHPALALGGKDIRLELELLHNMMKNIVVLQMDLGIRHKVEQAQNHLHVNLEPHQKKLMADFNDMQQITEVTTKALELLTGNSRHEVISDVEVDAKENITKEKTSKEKSTLRK